MSKWASYESVKPPEIDSDWFNKSVSIEDFYSNPISQMFSNYVTPSQTETEEVIAAPEEDSSSSKKRTKRKKTEAKTIYESKTNDSEYTKFKGYAQFEQAFNEAVRRNPDVSKYKHFLTQTAQRESGFDSYVQNKSGAPYYGYFQMGKSEIQSTSNLSVEQFRKDPVAQILAACKLYEMNLASIKRLGVYELGKQKGYSDDALVSGAWLGGPGGVKKYLLGKGDPSDAHWFKNGNRGSSVGKIMNNWKNS